MFKKTQLCVAALTAMAGTAVWAQDAQGTTQTNAQTQRVEITGSRIRTIDAETSQPVQKVTQEQIRASGLVTVGDIINAISAAGSPDISKGAVLASGADVGGQYVNLRNLGAQRLLVLVDGKRWSQSLSGITDVSTIPSSMIERVEILKDGASSVYGSDAIAGVLNFILKKNLEGGEVSLYAGANSKGDGATKDFSLSFGANGEKSSMMFGLSLSKQGEVWAKDRLITSTSFGPDVLETGYLPFGTGPWGRIRQVNPVNGMPLLTGFNKYLNHTGTYDGSGVGEDPRDPASYHTFVGAEEDLFNSTQQMMFTAPTEMKSLFTRGTLELTDNVRFVATAMYADRSSWNQVAGYPLNSAAQPGYKVYVDKDSYYNPYGNQGVGIAPGAGQDLFFYRRMIEVPRVTTNNSRTLHIDAGLNGDVDFGGKMFNWDVGYNYSKVDGLIVGTGNLNLPNLKRALGPSFLNADGQVQCGTPSAPISLRECTPFNILGGPSTSTPEALAYVMANTTGSYGSTMTSLTANLTGELATLPAGGLGIAVGAEYRKLSGYDVPDEMSSSGYTTNLAAQPTKGAYSVKEVYGELNIPLIKDAPAADLLSLNLASRFSKYSNFGNTTNSKGSFIWKPYRDLMVRGTYAQGFRAPALDDTFGGGSQSYDSYLDPCDSRFGDAASNPATQANCAAAGVPTGFRQKQQSGAAVGGNGAQSPFPFLTFSNPNLTPEKATTKTVGFVLNPQEVPGLSFTLDWYKIQVNDRIYGLSAGDVLKQCYIHGVQQFCGLITRDATGQVNFLARGILNMGQLEASGFDIEMGYSLPATDFGKFGLRMQTSYVSSYKVKANAQADWVNYAGEYPIYKIKSNIGLDWKMGDWGATLGARIFSSAKTSPWDCDPASPLFCSDPNGNWSGGVGYNRTPTRMYNDLSVSYSTPWKGNIMVGVNNIFGMKPYINFDTAASASAVDPDLPIDRYFFVRYTQQF